MKKIKKSREKSKNTKFLSWFTLPQGLRSVLCKLGKIFTKGSQDQFTTLAPSKLQTAPSNKPTHH